jgi:hypothetical protein
MSSASRRSASAACTSGDACHGGSAAHSAGVSRPYAASLAS